MIGHLQQYSTFIYCTILLMLSPVAWALVDREPPWTRIEGSIDPTNAGSEFVVHWRTTPLERECSGTIQIEISSKQAVWPVLKRTVNPFLKLGQVDYMTPPWPLAVTVPPGIAIYRATSFWYCNWVQRLLNWPVVQVGPDIQFEVLPPIFPPGTKIGHN